MYFGTKLGWTVVGILLASVVVSAGVAGEGHRFAATLIYDCTFVVFAASAVYFGWRLVETSRRLSERPTSRGEDGGGGVAEPKRMTSSPEAAAQLRRMGVATASAGVVLAAVLIIAGPPWPS